MVVPMDSRLRHVSVRRPATAASPSSKRLRRWRSSPSPFLVATAFLQAHVQAARRLEVRSALVQASETTLEEIRGGLRPLVSANLDRGPSSVWLPGAGLPTSIKVDSGGVTDLFHVVVTSRSAAAGEPMEVTLETMVWRP